MRQQTLYVLQGPPGGGKSTLACMISAFTGALICSTDDFFMKDGEYVFNPAKLAEYHAANQARVAKALADGHSVIVDNTNTKRWEAKPYLTEAVRLDIPIVFIRVDGCFQSRHGVPPERIQQMRAAMENLDLLTCLAAKAPWE